jgi:hypothetical protein
MNMDNVFSAVCKHDIDLTDVDVKINKSVAELNGSTSPDKSVTLDLNAFANKDSWLGRLHANASTFTRSIREWGIATCDAGNRWEQAVVVFEDAWWAGQ